MTLKLPSVGAGRYELARHAHVIVYEAESGGELVTIYDCGAAQKPPSAQFIGNLVRIKADHELRYSPTGYVASLREPADLVQQDDDHWVIEPSADRR